MTILRLTTPIKHGNEEITELKFRKPLARDLKKFDARDITKYSNSLELSSILCALPVSVLENMDAVDLMRCNGVINNFFMSSQEILENV